MHDNKQHLRQIQLCIYTALLVLAKNNDSSSRKVIINSDADDSSIELFVKSDDKDKVIVFDLSLTLHNLPTGRIEVAILASKLTLNTNPVGSYRAKQKHSIFLSPPGEQHYDTIPHPSFVVEYIANDILGLGVG